MVARFHYEDDVYQSFLLDRLPDEEQSEVAMHLEACEDCQEKLEWISDQQDVTWDEVRRYLNSGEVLEGDLGSTVDEFSSASNESGTTLGFLDDTDNLDAIGLFGRYEIREVLGRGGMGIVLRGFDPALNRHSAIKVLAPELATHSAARKRFSREAKSAAAVVHEHVVPIQTVDDEKGLPYFVMPVIEGRSLEERVVERGPLEIKEVLRIGQQAARGLSAAHAQGLVHRDVKPANILLENGVERVMLTDFGLARAADDASMTRSGVIAGTPQYMSPEQSRGLEIDSRSDLFSLGSVLYFMCSGHSPFRAETTMGVLHRIVNDEPRSIRSVNPDIPMWMDSIISRLLNKDPDERFQSSDDVADLLGKWLAHLNQPDTVPPPEPLVSERKASDASTVKWLAGAAGIFLLALATWTIVLELAKGTLTIESVDENVKIRITQGHDVVKRLTITGGKGQTRIAAGTYQVEIDGDNDTLQVDGGKIILGRGDAVVARITHKQDERSSSPLAHPSPGETTAEPFGLPGPPENPLGQPVDPLLHAIRQFNESLSESVPDVPLAPLTDDEVLAWARWNLRFASSPARNWFLNIIEHRRLPHGTEFQASVVNVRLSDKLVVPCYRIGLNPAFSVDEESGARAFIREQCILDGRFDSSDRKMLSDSNAKTLATFNAFCKRLDSRHSSISAKEILASLMYAKEYGQTRVTKSKPYAAIIDQCLATMKIPDSATFELSTHFGPYDGTSYRIWSPRIRFQKPDGSGSRAFPIRNQFLSSQVHDDSDIHWGPPAANGLQAGVRLSPSGNVYNIGQEIRVEICYRTTGGKTLPGILPNVLSYVGIEAFDASGKIIRTAVPKFVGILAGAMSTRFDNSIVAGNSGRLIIRSKDAPQDKGPPPALDGDRRTFTSFENPQTAYIYAEPGQSCRIRFVVHDYSREGKGNITTGYVPFTIAANSGEAENLVDQPATESPRVSSKLEVPIEFSPTEFKLRVVDDNTGEPIDEFTVGAQFGGDDDPQWKDLFANSKKVIDGGVLVTVMRNDLKGKRMRVVANGYIPKLVGDRVLSKSADTPIEVRLTRGKAFSGTVVDHKGEPVSASVFLLRGSHQNKAIVHHDASHPVRYLASAPYVTSIYTADGQIEITGLNDEQMWLAILTSGPSLMFHELTSDELERKVPLLIKLPEPGSLEIRYPDRQDSTYVTLRQASGLPIRSISSNFEQSINEDGNLQIEGLSPGKYVLSIMNRGKVRHVRTALREIEVKAGDLTTIEFEPAEGSPLNGSLAGMTARGFVAASLTLTRKDNHTKEKSFKYVEADEAVSIEGDGGFKTRPLREGWYKWRLDAYAPDNPNAPLRLPAYSTEGEIYIPDDEPPKALEIMIPRS